MIYNDDFRNKTKPRFTRKALFSSTRLHQGILEITEIVGDIQLPTYFKGIDNIEDLLSPSSIDIPLNRFYDLNGNKLSFPIELNQGETIIGESDLELYLELDESLFCCLETRSSVARTGLAATGFVTDDDYRIFLDINSNKEIKIRLTNYNPNKYIIEKPIKPAQISVARKKKTTQDFFPSINIEGKPKEYMQFGKIIGYPLHLDEEVWCIKKIGKVYYENKADEKFYLKTTIHDPDIKNFDFNLALSKEKISCTMPAYVFPFHLDDINKFKEMMTTPVLLSLVFEEVFIKRNKKYLPITANAGLCNPGWSGKIVFENITKDVNNLEEYFRKDKPFAFLIPVPFFFESKYNGRYNNQSSICL